MARSNRNKVKQTASKASSKPVRGKGKRSALRSIVNEDLTSTRNDDKSGSIMSKEKRVKNPPKRKSRRRMNDDDEHSTGILEEDPSTNSDKVSQRVRLSLSSPFELYQISNSYPIFFLFESIDLFCRQEIAELLQDPNLKATKK